MVKLKINEKSVSAKLASLREALGDRVSDKLEDIAFDLTTRSPVDTGAFAESFSVVPSSSGAGRRVSSHGRPKGQDIQAYRELAYRNMQKDIGRLDLENLKGSVSFRNRAPHAGKVEKKYQVFGAVKDKERDI